MASWRDGEESLDDGKSIVGAEIDLLVSQIYLQGLGLLKFARCVSIQPLIFVQFLQEIPDTVVDPSLCSSVLESEPKRIFYGESSKKMVAFEGFLTGRRILGFVVHAWEEFVIFSSIVQVSVLCSSMLYYN